MEMDKLSQTFTTDTWQYLHFNSHHPQNSMKSIPYTLACRICTIVVNKKPQKNLPKDTKVINKGFELAEKIPLKELWTPRKHNEKPLTYITTYNKNNPELFTEITKNLKELKNMTKSRKIQDITKIIKSQGQAKNL